MLKDASHIKAPNIPLSSFETYFKAVNNPDDHFFNPDEDVLYFNERFVNNEFHVMFGELDVPISNIEITTAIKKLKTGKSAGPDMLLNEFLIYGIG